MRAATPSSAPGETRSDAPTVVHDLVVAANRLPVRRTDEGEWEVSPGGLVTAMESVMAGRDAAWIGWDGTYDETAPFRRGSLALHPVPLSVVERQHYYERFANGTLWPLYHHGALPPEFSRRGWTTYRAVNQRFADAAAEALSPDGTLWVHDYHLQLVPAMVRAMRPDTRIGFFLHTPLAPAQLARRLPWRADIVEGLLGADVIGFQTTEDARSFLSLLRYTLGGGAEPMLVSGRAQLVHHGRVVSIGSFPISIDVERVHELATSSAAEARARQLRHTLGDPRHLLLGVDRLDYTKGIDARLRAFRMLLDSGEVDPGEVVFVQVATPSRDQVRGYRDMRQRIERLVGEINGDYARLGRPVVHYLHSHHPFEEIIGMYRAADVMVVTPYCDGMNLVAKEYVAARTDRSGALVLSEFAGAAVELEDALLCNPYDVIGLRRVLRDALTLSRGEQERRMAAMQARLRRHTVHDWARQFMRHLA